MSALPRLEDEWALRRLVLLYAHAVDRNQPDLLVSLFTEGAVVEGPNFQIAGRQQIRAVPGKLALKYRGTMHCVFNHTTDIAGDTAQGETYCIAYHGIESGDGQSMTLNLAIRYQDRYMRLGREWRFAHRQLVVQWRSTTKVESLPRPEEFDRRIGQYLTPPRHEI